MKIETIMAFIRDVILLTVEAFSHLLDGQYKNTSISDGVSGTIARRLYDVTSAR